MVPQPGLEPGTLSYEATKLGLDERCHGATTVTVERVEAFITRNGSCGRGRSGMVAVVVKVWGGRHAWVVL